MVTIDRYIDSVLGNIYAPPAKLAHFEAWLRLQVNHLEDKGYAGSQIMETLGDPEDLAMEMMHEDVTSRLRYAGGFRRIPAMLVDCVLLFAMLVFPVAMSVALIEEMNDVPPLVLVGLTTLVACALFVPVFFVMMDATRGRTPGKKLLGLRVVRTNGDKISFKDAFLRTVVLISPLVPFDLVTGLFSKRKQRLADMVAGTVVVRELRK